MRTVVSGTLVLLAVAVSVPAQSPYVGQQERNIKALAPQEIADYLAGKGMSLAKAAELNGYPGPAHVLELAVQLDLTAEQRTKTTALFQQMQASASALGATLVEAERQLDHLFATRTVTDALLAEALARLGQLQGQLRQVHLQAHLDQTVILTPQQVTKYNALRGYTASSGQGKHEHRHH